MSDLADSRFLGTPSLQPSAGSGAPLLLASGSSAPDLAMAMIQGMPDAVWLVDAQTRIIVAANAASERLFGGSLAMLLGREVAVLATTPEDVCFWAELANSQDPSWIAAQAQAPAPVSAPALAPAPAPALASDTWLHCHDGQVLPVWRQVTHIQAPPGAGYYMVSMRDRSGPLRVEEELEARIAELAATLESTADGILVVDLAGRIRNFNQRFAQLWDVPSDLLLRRDDDAVLDWMRTSVTDAAAYMRRLAVIDESAQLQSTDLVQLLGGRTLERVTLPQSSRGHAIGRVFSFRDITAQIEAAKKIDTLSHTDALTGLPNLRVFSDRVEFALAMAQRDGSPFSLLFVNLDRFNHINETLGHGFGDRVLAQVAERLSGCLRQVDTVARLGGDEFVLLVHQADAGGAAVAARRAIEGMQAPFTLEGMSFNVTCSIGIALYPADGQTLDELLRRADASMHEAKEAGRGQFRFHRNQPASDDSRKLTRLKLDHAMRQALASNRFRLHYQPQIDMQTGQVVGAEALLRWTDPELGPVSPADFIPVAEETGFIVAIGDWVMRQAIQQAAQWRSEGKNLTVAVNVSALQFQQPEFVDEVAKALEKSGLPADRLELELTESILIQNADEAMDRLARLVQLGVKLSIDDFGTGYSSLGYLKRFPISCLKIDRSFVRGLPGDASDVGIVTAIVTLGQALRLQIVAEGVETEAQRVFLQGLGCGQYQGFLFAPALDSSSFGERMDSHNSPQPASRAPIRLVSG